MSRINKYQVEYDEFLHPLWLGILMLLFVIIIVGMLCFLRRKCGSRIRYLFNRLCSRNELNDQHHSKINKHLPTAYSCNWMPTYNPAPSFSPKLYKVVRNIQMAASIDKESSIEHSNNNEENIENDESDYVSTCSEPLNQESNNNHRTCETARKFYASMRQTNKQQISTSVESYTNEPSLSTMNRLARLNRNDKLKFFRTTRFFQSITNKC